MPQLWQNNIALEVKIDQGDARVLREMKYVRAVMASKTLSSTFLLIASGVKNPGEIARRTGRTKYSVSFQITKLKEAQLIVSSTRSSSDLRMRNYEISEKKLVQIFKKDFAFEVELYENHLLSENLNEIKGSLDSVELAVLGNGRLGLVREVLPDKPINRVSELQRVKRKLDLLSFEFIQTFKTYIKERRFATLLEYYLAFYREMSLNHSRFPEESELGQFFCFIEFSITRLKPVEDLWRIAMTAENLSGFKSKEEAVVLPSLERVMIFSEAGKMDSAGRYIVNADSRSYMKPGVRVKIYPSYCFMEQERVRRLR